MQKVQWNPQISGLRGGEGFKHIEGMVCVYFFSGSQYLYVLAVSGMWLIHFIILFPQRKFGVNRTRPVCLSARSVYLKSVCLTTSLSVLSSESSSVCLYVCMSIWLPLCSSYLPFVRHSVCQGLCLVSETFIWLLKRF